MKKSDMVTAHSQETSSAIGGILWNSSIFRPLPAPLPPSEEMDLWWPGGIHPLGEIAVRCASSYKGFKRFRLLSLDLTALTACIDVISINYCVVFLEPPFLEHLFFWHLQHLWDELKCNCIVCDAAHGSKAPFNFKWMVLFFCHLNVPQRKVLSIWPLDLTDLSLSEASNNAFAAICKDWAVVSWGAKETGGDQRTVQDQLQDVQEIQAQRGKAWYVE